MALEHENSSMVQTGWTPITSHSTSPTGSSGSPLPSPPPPTLLRSSIPSSVPRQSRSLPILPPRRLAPSPQLNFPRNSPCHSRSISPQQEQYAFPSTNSSPSQPLAGSASPHVYYDYTIPSSSPRPPTSVLQGYHAADPRPGWAPAGTSQGQRERFEFGEGEIVYGNYDGFAMMEE